MIEVLRIYLISLRINEVSSHAFKTAILLFRDKLTSDQSQPSVTVHYHSETLIICGKMVSADDLQGSNIPGETQL